MDIFVTVFLPILAAGLAVWFILWARRRRWEAGHRDDEDQPTGPVGF